MIWVTSPPTLLQIRHYSTCEAHESSNRVYAIGGEADIWGNRYLNTIEYLDISDMSIIETKLWTLNPTNLTYPASDLSSIAFHDFIYVIGGKLGGSQWVPQTQIIDTITNDISLGASFYENGISDTSAIIINNVIYVFGGIVPGMIQGNNNVDVYQYNTMYVNNQIRCNDNYVTIENASVFL